MTESYLKFLVCTRHVAIKKTYSIIGLWLELANYIYIKKEITIFVKRSSYKKKRKHKCKHQQEV